MQGNLKVDILEFVRTWCQTKGYFDLKIGMFKQIADFGTVSAENSDYRRTYCKVEDR